MCILIVIERNRRPLASDDRVPHQFGLTVPEPLFFAGCARSMSLLPPLDRLTSGTKGDRGISIPPKKFSTQKIPASRGARSELNRRGVPTPAGGKWHAKTVLRVRKRLI